MGSVLAFIAALAGGGTFATLIQAFLYRQRDQRQAEQQSNLAAAQADNMAAAAHAAIYQQYGVLLDEIRQDAAMARQQAAAAREDARDASNRAAVAEARAAGAELRATSAEAQLREMRDLVQRHVPNADVLLRSFAQLAELSGRNGQQSALPGTQPAPTGSRSEALAGSQPS